MCIILQILQIIILMNWYYILVIVLAILLVFCVLVLCMVLSKCPNWRNVSEKVELGIPFKNSSIY